jgi:hypothetical protein
MFAAHNKIRGFVKKLVLWKKNIEDRKYDCFETFETFIIKNEVKPADGIISTISINLIMLKENLDCYFLEEVENYQQNHWIANPFQSNTMTGISTKANKELTELPEDTALKMNFNHKKRHSSGCLFNKSIQLFLLKL